MERRSAFVSVSSLEWGSVTENVKHFIPHSYRIRQGNILACSLANCWKNLVREEISFVFPTCTILRLATRYFRLCHRSRSSNTPFTEPTSFLSYEKEADCTVCQDESNGVGKNRDATRVDGRYLVIHDLETNNETASQFTWDAVRLTQASWRTRTVANLGEGKATSSIGMLLSSVRFYS